MYVIVAWNISVIDSKFKKLGWRAISVSSYTAIELLNIKKYLAAQWPGQYKITNTTYFFSEDTKSISTEATIYMAADLQQPILKYIEDLAAKKTVRKLNVSQECDIVWGWKDAYSSIPKPIRNFEKLHDIKIYGPYGFENDQHFIISYINDEDWVEAALIFS